MHLAVFGHPVTHSLSPRIHRLFGKQVGLEIDYRAIEAPAGTLARALSEFAAGGGTGCNVTLPLKEEAMALAGQCSDRVKRAGAANTLLATDDGWRAETTDGAGLVADLRRLDLDPAGKRLALIGAGGAAAGVTAALLETGPASLAVYNRNAKRAVGLATGHADLGPVSGHGLDALAEAGRSGDGFDLVLNATSLGHDGDRPPLARGLFAPRGVLYDLNYGEAARPLLSWARERAIPCHDGLGMLVGQAAESFRLWTGRVVDVAGVLRALKDGIPTDCDIP